MADNEEIYRIVVDAEGASRSLHLFEQNVDAGTSSIIRMRDAIDQFISKINTVITPVQSVSTNLKSVNETAEITVQEFDKMVAAAERGSSAARSHGEALRSEADAMKSDADMMAENIIIRARYSQAVQDHIKSTIAAAEATLAEQHALERYGPASAEVTRAISERVAAHTMEKEAAASVAAAKVELLRVLGQEALGTKLSTESAKSLTTEMQAVVDIGELEVGMLEKVNLELARLEQKELQVTEATKKIVQSESDRVAASEKIAATSAASVSKEIDSLAKLEAAELKAAEQAEARGNREFAAYERSMKAALDNEEKRIVAAEKVAAAEVSAVEREISAEVQREQAAIKEALRIQESAEKEVESIDRVIKKDLERQAVAAKRNTPAATTSREFSAFRTDAREGIYAGLGVAWAAESMGMTGLGPLTQGGLAATAILTLVDAELKKVAKSEDEVAIAGSKWATIFSAGNLLQFGLGIGAIVGGLVLLHESLKSFEDMNKELVTTGRQFGLTIQQMAAFSLAAKATGASGQDFVRTVGQLNREIVQMSDSIVRGKTPTSEMAHALDALGISLTTANGKAKNSFDVILELADAFKRQAVEAKENGTANEVAGRAVELFGARGATLVPILAEGSEQIRHYMELVKELGVGTDDQAEKFHKLEAATAEFHFVLQAAMASMGSALVPIVVGVTQAAEAVALAFGRLDAGARTLAVGLGIAAGAFTVLRLALILLGVSNPFTLVLAGAIALAPVLLGLKASMDGAGESMSTSEKKAAAFREELRRLNNEITDMTSKPSKEELGLKAQIDVTGAAISKLQAQIANMGTGAMSVAKLQEELDNLLKSGATIDQVTQKQKDLAAVINTSSNPALARQVAEMQKNIDSMKDENTVLSAEEKALKDSRQATQSLLESRGESAKGIKDLASGLIEYRDKLTEAGSADQATINMINSVITTINGSAEQVKEAGTTAGTNFGTGLAAEGEASGEDLAGKAAEGIGHEDKKFEDAGKKSAQNWFTGFVDYIKSLGNFWGGEGMSVGDFAQGLDKLLDQRMGPKPGPGVMSVTDRDETGGTWVTDSGTGEKIYYVNGVEIARIKAGTGEPSAPSAPSTGSEAAAAPKPGGAKLNLSTQPAPSHKQPKAEKPPVQTAYGEFLAARGDVGDFLAQDQYGKLASKGIADLETGVRQPAAAGAGRDLFNQIQQLTEKGREANLPNLAELFNTVADAAEKALGERTPEAAEEARNAIMMLAAAVSGAQLDVKMTEQIKGVQNALDQVFGGGEEGMVGSWQSGLEKIDEGVTTSLQQLWESITEGGAAAQAQKAGKEAANLYVQGFQQSLKGDRFIEGLDDKLEEFAMHVQDQLEAFDEKFADSPVKRIKKFADTYLNGIKAQDKEDSITRQYQDKREEAEVQHQERLADIKAHGGKDVGSKLADENLKYAEQQGKFNRDEGRAQTEQRQREIDALNLKNQKDKFKAMEDAETERVEAGKLAMKLIKEAQLKDKEIQDQVDKFNREQSDAEKVTQLKLELENILNVNEEAMRRAKLQKELDAIDQREAREKKALAEATIRDLTRHENRMAQLKDEEIAFIHANLGETPEAEDQIASVMERWEGIASQIAAGKEDAQGVAASAQETLDKYPAPNREDLMKQITSFNPADALAKAKQQLISARPEAAGYLGPQTAVSFGGSALANSTPQIQGLLNKAYPGGTPFSFRESLQKLGLPDQTIAGLAGGGAAGRTAGALQQNESQKQDQHLERLSSIDHRLAGPITTRWHPDNVQQMRDAVAQLHVVQGGQTTTREVQQNIINDAETRRMVTGRY